MNAASDAIPSNQAFSSADSNAPQGISPDSQLLLTVITPAYNEARNLPVLYERLGQVLAELNMALGVDRGGRPLRR